MKFRMIGAVAPVPLTGCAARVRAFLDEANDGDLWTSIDLAKEVKSVRSTLSHSEVYGALPDYTMMSDEYVDGRRRRVRLWGNPATIKEYREYKDAK